MLARQKEDRKEFSSTLRTDLYKDFNEYHKQTLIPKTKLLDKAIEEFLNKYKNKIEQE